MECSEESSIAYDKLNLKLRIKQNKSKNLKQCTNDRKDFVSPEEQFKTLSELSKMAEIFMPQKKGRHLKEL
jgi:hypothetical protein